MKPTIFLGSSKEAQDQAKIIQSLLFDNGADVVAWWEGSSFPAGTTFVESLFALAKKTNASLLLASEDDQVNKRGKMKFLPRDNVMFEHGLFAAAHGRTRSAIATLGNPELPTDLLGVAIVRLEEADSLGAFKERNRESIRQWTEQLKHPSSQVHGSTLADAPEREHLLLFMQEMDGIWADLDAGWNRIHRQDHIAERNFAIALDEFFQVYHRVFSELISNPEAAGSVEQLISNAVSEAKECCLKAWEHVAEGKLRLADELANDHELKAQLRGYKDLYEKAALHLRQGKRGKKENRYEELVKAVAVADEYMAKANVPTR